MRRMLLVLSLVVLARSAAAQPVTTFTTQPQPQMPGGRGQQPAAADLPPGTAILRGRVFAADTGQPLRKAQVRLVQMPEASQNAAMTFRENKLATTNENGLYEFKELRAGRYQLSASKGSYVSLSYGQARPTEPGKPIQLLDAQTIERVDFLLPRGAVITGKILDEYGEPLPDVTVVPQRYQYVQGQRRLVPAGRTSFTDDLGEFRLFGVPPGQYYLQATWRSQNPLGPGGAGASTGYAPMYFPGTLDVAQARRLTIGVGVEMSDVVMTMRPVKTARVTGTALDSQGRPMRAMLMVMQDVGFGGGFSMGAPVQPDGSFTLSGLVPGEYTLRVQQMTNPQEAETGNIHVTVGSDDISGLQIMASRPTFARGRIVVDPAAASALPQRLMLILSPVVFMPMMGTMPGAVLDDMSFELKGAAGKYRINLGPGATGWTVRSVRWNASDVTDSGFEIKPNEDIGGLEVEITNRLTTISGLVTNARGEQLKDYSTVVFPQDPARWGGATRYQSVGRPDQDGRFKITGLPAGAYYIIALDRVDSGEAGDPEFLERIRLRASTLSLNEGETKTLDLRVQTAER